MNSARRLASAALALLACLLAAEALAGVLYSPAFVWNEIRLFRSLALLHGYSLYPGRDATSPVIGTLHTPVSHCLYLLVAGFHSPTRLLLAGSLLSMALVFVPLAWVLLRAGQGSPDRLGAAFVFLYCGFLIMQTPGTFHVASMIHNDAAVLAFGTLACGVFCNPRRAISVSQVWLSGIACVLAIGSKQTAAPMVLAIALFIALTAGVRLLAHFVMAVLAGAAVLFAGILAFVPARDFLFNTVTLAAHRPLKRDYLEVLVTFFRDGKQDALPALFPIILLGAGQWIGVKRPSLREFVQANRWMVFAISAAVLLPVTVKAIVTVGSDVNHMGLALYFLFVAAGLAILQFLRDAEHPFLRSTAWLCASLGILIGLAPGTLLSLPSRFREVRHNPPEAALDYARRHPGQAYFPCNPMASLLLGGKAYHVDYSVNDREIGGYPLTAQQYDAGLPPGFQVVAIPPGQQPRSRALRNLLERYDLEAATELPGWSVYRRRQPPTGGTEE